MELIKMVYEKVLALDHHFAALQTYQNIAQMTNPNAYPEFQNAKTLLEKKQIKEIIHYNCLLFWQATLNFVVSSTDQKEKDVEIEKNCLYHGLYCSHEF